MDPAGAAGAGVAWPGRGGPGDGRRDFSSPSSIEPPHKKVRNNAFQSYPSEEETRGDGLDGFSSHPQSGQGYRGPPFNPGYGGQQQMQMPSNGYAHSSGPNYNPSPSGFPPGSAKGTGALFLKTKLCTKFKLGTCTFDDRCHFAHGMEDLRKPPVGWETMIANAGQGGPLGSRSNDGLPERKKSSKPCRFFADGKECPYGERCTFVHAPSNDAYPPSGFGNSESGGIPPSSGRFKTRICARWERGEPCNYGERCHYAHGYAELQNSAGVPTHGNDNVGAGNNIQYPSSSLEMAPPYATQYPNANMVNAPPATASYGGGPFTMMNTNAPSSVYPTAAGTNAPPSAYPTAGTNAPPNAYPTAGTNGVPNMYPTAGTNVYPSAGTSAPPNTYPTAGATAPPNAYATAGTGAQDDYPKPQSYWNGVPPPVQAGFAQANQAAAGWPGNHIADGGYSKDPSNAVQYIPAPIQQQSGLQQPYASGSAGVYQEPNKQMTNVPYIQDGSRANYQSDAMAGKGGYYPATY